MASNPPTDTFQVAPVQPPASAPLSHADTYAARLAETLADADSFFEEGMALLGVNENGSPTETRAPATPNGTAPPPTTPTAPTNAGSEAQGPATSQDGTRPAAADTSSATDTAGDDEGFARDRDGRFAAKPSSTPTTGTDPTTERNRRRAESQQSILAREKAQLESRLAAMEEQNRQLLHDNRVLFGQHETVRETAKKQGAIRFEDVDQALIDSAAQQVQARQAEEMQLRQQQEQVLRQSAQWQQAVGERVNVGENARKDAINAILASAIETKQEITLSQAEEMVKEGYSDAGVLADIQLWRSDRVPTDLANERIRFAYQRIADMGKQKLVQKAVAALKAEAGDIPVYNRDQPYGGADAAPAAGAGRHLTYQQRLQADLSAASTQMDRDMKKLLG